MLAVTLDAQSFLVGLALATLLLLTIDVILLGGAMTMGMMGGMAGMMGTPAGWLLVLVLLALALGLLVGRS